MPICYQANIKEKKITYSKLSRLDCGLNENDFVFCCFNQNYKFTPFIFSLWIEILKSTNNSVLWLYLSTEDAKENILQEASKNGVSEDRFVFAMKLPNDMHLARIKLADLFLDTYPYGAHTTASDAIRVGLPIITLQGKSFASRVSASLLHSIDLDELITSSREEYLKLALELASNKKKINLLKSKIIRNVKKSALFDSGKFTKDFEFVLEDIFKKNLIYKN
jgi:predicted O-linked N-acetylglucosamine transferase (SPINDLY family)